MYVLHHADKPEIYANLPNNPRISPVVEAWKGVSKYAGMAAMGLAAAAGLLHYIFKGPNVVTEHDEEQAEKLTGEKSS
jgi:formate dehydrogenase iron-sulfur subunit